MRTSRFGHVRCQTPDAETTYDAEFVALTQLQADVFVTSDGDLARAVSGLVETATIDALRTA
jgi:predicted nucleic acid-binding protein